jgi:hypothetical protein
LQKQNLYKSKVAKLLNAEEKQELVDYLSEHPNAGVLIQGTSGIRKLRWAKNNQGKSGSVRVIYYFHSDFMPLYLLAIFGKNEKANISAQEKNLLAILVKQLVNYWRQRQ